MELILFDIERRIIMSEHSRDEASKDLGRIQAMLRTFYSNLERASERLRKGLSGIFSRVQKRRREADVEETKSGRIAGEEKLGEPASKRPKFK